MRVCVCVWSKMATDAGHWWEPTTHAAWLLLLLLPWRTHGLDGNIIKSRLSPTIYTYSPPPTCSRPLPRERITASACMCMRPASGEWVGGKDQFFSRPSDVIAVAISTCVRACVWMCVCARKPLLVQLLLVRIMADLSKKTYNRHRIPIIIQRIHFHRREFSFIFFFLYKTDFSAFRIKRRSRVVRASEKRKRAGVRYYTQTVVYVIDWKIGTTTVGAQRTYNIYVRPRKLLWSVVKKKKKNRVFDSYVLCVCVCGLLLCVYKQIDVTRHICRIRYLYTSCVQKSNRLKKKKSFSTNEAKKKRKK